jgi:hypothetical protein
VSHNEGRTGTEDIGKQGAVEIFEYLELRGGSKKSMEENTL